MANDVKWIKLKVGMFDGMSFKKIKRAKIGGESFRDKLTAVWFELMDFAGKCNHNGAFVDSREIPFKELSDIAMMIDREEEELQLCMTFYINEGMVSIVDDVYMLSTWSAYQNTEGLDKIREQTRKRVAKHREKQKLIAGNGETICQYCGTNATGIDHIVALARGGKDIDSNKIPCCIECNRIKNDKPVVDFLNSNRDRINDEIVLSNSKLSHFVTLCNATNCYTVTEDNATDIDIEEDKEREKEDINNIVPSPPSSKSKKPIKHKYGEYNNVLLTDAELEKLKTEYSDYEERIERLSSYVASTGKSYKSHYATIRNWARKDTPKQQTQAETPEFLKKWSI